MKYRYFIVIISLFFLFPFKVQAGGCIAGYDNPTFTTRLSVTPPIDCLEVKLTTKCATELVLDIVNRCDDAFIYEKDGQVFEFHNYQEFSKIKNDNPNAVFNLRDKVPQSYYTEWTKTLYKKDNPEEKIIIKGVVLLEIPFPGKNIVIDSFILRKIFTLLPILRF